MAHGVPLYVLFCLNCLTNEVPQVQWSSVTPPDGGSGSDSAPSEVDFFLAEIKKLASTSLELAPVGSCTPSTAASRPGTLQPEMSREAAVSGGLDMQLVYYCKRESNS